jgi:Spy/CpxP family protein refolding chaperone
MAAISSAKIMAKPAPPPTCDMRRHAMGVNHRGHGIGRVMKSTNELEAERDQQGDTEQQEGADRHRRRMRRLDVADQSTERVAQADQQQYIEDDGACGVRASVQIRSSRKCCNGFRHSVSPTLFVQPLG